MVLALGAAACAPVAPPAPPIVSLAGVEWRVVAVNGRATPGTSDYSMRFVSGQLTARFGCNHMGGGYQMADGLLVAGPISSTRMACSEPAGSLEQQGGAVLGQPMRVAESTSGRVTLINEAGSIALERTP